LVGGIVGALVGGLVGGLVGDLVEEVVFGRSVSAEICVQLQLDDLSF
jgi:hypothetical protein